MEKFSHTPGPWRVTGVMSGHKGDVYVPTADRIPDCHHIARCFAPKPQGEVYCELQAIGIERDAIAQIEANATLIAAAPELLEALRLAKRHIAHMARWIEGRSSGYSFEALGEDMPSIDAAIAKAMGE
jgi:hypothetical protein